MLSEERNQLLTQVGPGTPMGNLLRRYWHPIAGISEFDSRATKALRILGEDLVLYKDLGGNFGLLDRHCCHRRADLSYGMVEQCGLRCNYHGWLYDHNGKCLAQPYTDVAYPEKNFRDDIRIKAYLVSQQGGMLWAYMGPDPAPLLPNYEAFSWKNGFTQIVLSEVPCNWFQCQENSCDPVHFEWMHGNWSKRLRGDTGPYLPTHLKLAFDEFEHGIIYRRVIEGTDEESPPWTVGRVCLWPHGFFLGDHFEWRIPIDDDNTLSIGWFFNRVPRDREPYGQKTIPTWNSPIRDPETGEWIDNYVMNQDFLAWVGQGVVADRTKENLGPSDAGITKMRKRFFSDLDALANDPSFDPKAIIRDPNENQCIVMPVMRREQILNGFTREEIENPKIQVPNQLLRFQFLYGQPQEVRDAYEEATGIRLRPGGMDENTRPAYAPRR